MRLLLRKQTGKNELRARCGALNKKTVISPPDVSSLDLLGSVSYGFLQKEHISQVRSSLRLVRNTVCAAMITI